MAFCCLSVFVCQYAPGFCQRLFGARGIPEGIEAAYHVEPFLVGFSMIVFQVPGFCRSMKMVY